MKRGDLDDTITAHFRVALIASRCAVVTAAVGLTSSPLFAVLAVVNQRWWHLTFHAALTVVFAAVLRFNMRQIRAIRTQSDVRSARPTPPTNVRVRYPDGTEIPVEVFYDGVSGGVHSWVVTTAVPLVEGMTIAIGVLPAHTAVSLRCWRQVDG